VSASASCRLPKAYHRGLKNCFALFAGLIVSVGLVAAEPLSIEVAKAQALQDKKTKEAVLSVTLKETSKKEFNEFTEKIIGQTIVLRFQGRVLLTATVRDPIKSGVLHISGNLTTEDTKLIAKQLQEGAKLEVDVVQQ